MRVCGCEDCRRYLERVRERWDAARPVGEVPAVTREDLAQGGVRPGFTPGRRGRFEWDREREARADAVDRARFALDVEGRTMTADELLKVARWIVTGDPRPVPTYVLTDDSRGGRKLWRR